MFLLLISFVHVKRSANSPVASLADEGVGCQSPTVVHYMFSISKCFPLFWAIVWLLLLCFFYSRLYIPLVQMCCHSKILSISLKKKKKQV